MTVHDIKPELDQTLSHFASKSRYLSTADATVETLKANGISTVFGLPGLHNDPLFDSCYRLGIRIVHTRHEQTTGYMALGAAMSTGAPQVNVVVPGPGVLNTAAAMLTAEGNCAPVLTIGGQIPQVDIDRDHGHLHEIYDQKGLARHISKYSERIRAPYQATKVINDALNATMGERPGPAFVECAMDIWARQAAVPIPEPASGPTMAPVDDQAIMEAAKLIADTKFPMIVVGAGAVNAYADVTELAERLGAPVLSYRGGRGVLRTDHELAISLPVGHKLWDKVDLAIVIGTRFMIQQTQWGTDKNLKVIRIDADPEAPDRFAKPDITMVGRAEDFVPALLEQIPLGATRRPDVMAALEDKNGWFTNKMNALEPQQGLLKAMRRALPDHGIFVDEVTQLGFASRLAFPVYEPRKFLCAGYQDNLGWGYGTALGAQAANPGTPVLSIAGDGGFMYQVGELATAVHHNLPVVVVIFDSNGFANVQRIQRERFGGRQIAADLTNPDFIALAEAFGVQGLRAETAEELEQQIRVGFASEQPTLVHVPCSDMPSVWDMLLMPRVRG
ncbi:MAG: thiamine pyrophosphate-binding protein [Aestuariivita sp.]|nr:thiamine pyrophosphate-binding protein [Aestuariivita sp.]MCY4203436.1 thiamine pyrophosphate-binding protein [Aestuariivita sp.]